MDASYFNTEHELALGNNVENTSGVMVREAFSIAAVSAKIALTNGTLDSPQSVQ